MHHGTSFEGSFKHQKVLEDRTAYEYKPERQVKNASILLIFLQVIPKYRPNYLGMHASVEATTITIQVDFQKYAAPKAKNEWNDHLKMQQGEDAAAAEEQTKESIKYEAKETNASHPPEEHPSYIDPIPFSRLFVATAAQIPLPHIINYKSNIFSFTP